VKRAALLACAVCLSALLTAARGEVTVEEDGTLSSFGVWRRLPDLPESKEQFGLEACAGRIYAVAGICEGQETDSAFVYDVAARQWSPIAPLPREAQSVCLRAVNRRLFCFGGYDHRIALKYDDVWLYDPDFDVWIPRSPMPVAREDAGSAVIDGRVWIVGGLTNVGHVLVGRIDIYDPELDLWLPPMTLPPTETDWPGRALGDFGCAFDRFVFCLGGTETMERYSWRLQPASWGFFTDGTVVGYLDIPDPRCYAEVETVRGLLCIVGGCRQSLTDYADTMLLYDAARQVWRYPVPLPYAARGQGACSWDDVLYVAGGYDGHTRPDFCQWMEDERIGGGEISPNAEGGEPTEPDSPVDESGTAL
jgi:hypothetical protein